MLTEEEQIIQATISSRLIQLNAPITGIVMGLIAGIGLFAATLFLVLKGGEVVGPHLSLLGQFFPGYSVTLIGSFVGLIYGFIAGFLAGYLIARLYNGLATLRERRRLP
jgi:hypothetical protein